MLCSCSFLRWTSNGPRFVGLIEINMVYWNQSRIGWPCYVIVHVCIQLLIVHLVYPIVQKGVKSDQAIHMCSSGFNVASISIWSVVTNRSKKCFTPENVKKCACFVITENIIYCIVQRPIKVYIFEKPIDRGFIWLYFQTKLYRVC